MNTFDQLQARDEEARIAEALLVENTEKWDEPADGPQPPEPPRWRDDDGVLVTELD